MILSKEPLVVWLGLVAFGTVALIFVGGKMSLRAGTEQQTAADVSVVPIQLGRETYGLAMVDAKNETLWIYEINTRGPAHSRLKLLAARSWHYDKMLKEYNSAEPKPEQVRDIIEQLLRPGSVPRSESNNLDITSVAEPNKLE